MNQENKENLPDIRANNDGQLVGNSLGEQMRIARYYVESGLVPKGINTPAKALIALQYCMSLGIMPSVGMRQICVVNGRPSIWGDLPLAIVRKSKQLKKITEMITDENDNQICPENKNLSAAPYAGICQLIREDNGEIIERFFTMEDAKRAGLMSSDCWRKYPRDMLKYRARAQALKDGFSDVLAGAAIAEYDFGILPEREPTKTFITNEKVNQETTDHFLKPEPLKHQKEFVESDADYCMVPGAPAHIVPATKEELTREITADKETEFEKVTTEDDPEQKKECVKVKQECVGCDECKTDPA